MTKSNMNKKTYYFKTRDEWHKWLLKNYDKKDEVWLVYYKKKTGKPTISYDDAVEEALCFGWIDGRVNKIDDEKYMQKYTPRRAGSVWSEINLKRVKKLIKEGRMTKAGMDTAKDMISGKVKAEPGAIPNTIPMPKELEVKLKKNKTAWDNFNNFPPSTKKVFFFWIINAKQEETKVRRIKKTVKAAIDKNKFGYM